MRKIFLLCLLAFSFSTSAQLVANDDVMPYVNGLVGNSNLGNIFDNDSLNGNPVALTDISVTVNNIVPPPFANVPYADPLTGVVSVVPQTAAGNYLITYTICEIANPNNCDEAQVIVSVAAAPIVANNDFGNSSTSGGIGFSNVLANDSLNGTLVLLNQIYLSSVSSTNPGVTLSGTNVVVAPGTPPGNYTLTYQICEILNPSNCDVATVFVTVTSPFIDAVDDTFTVTSLTNNTYNVYTNDTLNGQPISGSNVVATVLSSPIPVTIDSNGFLVFQATVGIPPTPPPYVILYIICDVSNPNNCDNATVTINTANCSIQPPTITSIIQPDCNNANGGVVLNDLPDGNWTLNLLVGGLVQTSINGSGNTTTLNNLSSGGYLLSVTEGICTSQSIFFELIESNGISVELQGTYTDFNNDGFTNVGDIINYQITVSNTNCTLPLSNITLANSALNLSGGPLTTLAPLTSDSTTFTASHVLTQENINSGTITHSITAQGTLNATTVSNSYTSSISLALSDGIKLNAFLDANNNGVQDGAEPNINVGDFSYQINNGVIHNVISPNGVVHLYESNSSNNYTVGYTLNSAFSSIYSVTPSSYSNLTVGNGTGISTYNFAVTALPFTDISAHIVPFGSPRPGFQFGQIIYVANNGNTSINSGTLTFTHDPALTISSISVSGTTPTANGFTYEVGPLAPGQYIWIYVYMTVPTIPTVYLGQIVTHTASVSTSGNDIFLDNNTSVVSLPIIGSYDPNDKQESHGGRIEFDAFTAADYLTYTIRFENTGTAEAINIRVEDVLNNQLDESTLRMVAASHNYVLDRVGSNLTWRFDGVNLPPSVPDTQIGHGFITFQIKPKSGYAVGDIIPNTAEIYFDFNPAIVTNTCTTEFVETLSNENFTFANLSYFPNPVKNSLTISNESVIDSIEISSILGQNMLTQKVNSLETEVDMSTFSNGIYFVKVTANGLVKTIKIVKE